MNKLIKSEKLISALTTALKFIAAAAVVVSTFYAGFIAVREIMFNKWARESIQETRYISDSLLKIQILQRLDIVTGAVDTIKEDIKIVKGMTSITSKAIDRHLKNENKWEERFDYQQDQIDVLKKKE